MAKKYKAFKVTISGTYQTSSKETIDYEDVVGLIPFCDNEKVALKHIRNRYAARWIKDAIAKDADYSKRDRVHRVREVFIDEMEETTSEFSFIGKDILDMSFEELQDFATLKDINEVPLTKGGIKQQREIAFKNYAKQIGLVIADDADIKSLPALKVEDEKSVTSKPKPKKDIEEIIQEEAKGSTKVETKGSGKPAPAKNEAEVVENPFAN